MPDTFPTKNWQWPVAVPADDGEAIKMARGLLAGWNRMCADRDELVAALDVCHPKHDFSAECDFCRVLARIKAGK